MVNRNYITFPLLISVLIIGGVYTGFLFTPKPPSESVEQAFQALTEAKRTRADEFAPKLFSKAQNLYDSALFLWKAENNKFIFKRNFAIVDTCIKQSIVMAKFATNKALANSKNIEVSTAATIKLHENKANKFEKIMVGLPLSSATRRDFQKGRLLLAEAKSDYTQKNYLLSTEKLSNSGNYLESAISDIKELLVSYFKSYPSWKKWVNETISSSKKGHNYTIVIDKIAKQCLVYKNGNLKHTFTIELGKNWIGDKRVQGDKSTPEGIYRVTRKLDSKKTKYYKALLINYPNDEDKKRFREEVKNGSLPPNARIGGLIEIHGDGGKGVDWTDGCIALSNKDMDIVYKIADVNTTVTIVGSLVELRKIFDF